MWGGDWVWFKKELIEQIVASLPQSTRLEYLQFFNEDFHLVLQQDFNNPDDIESDLVNCLITLKDSVRNEDEIITYLSYMESMVSCLEELQIPVPVAGLPQKIS